MTDTMMNNKNKPGDRTVVQNNSKLVQPDCACKQHGNRIIHLYDNPDDPNECTGVKQDYRFRPVGSR